MPDVETIAQIGAELGLSTERIISAAGYSEDVVVAPTEERALEFRKRFSALSPDEQDAVWPSVLQDLETVRRLRQRDSA